MAKYDKEERERQRERERERSLERMREGKKNGLERTQGAKNRNFAFPGLD